jgi:hypothetical protein
MQPVPVRSRSSSAIFDTADGQRTDSGFEGQQEWGFLKLKQSTYVVIENFNTAWKRGSGKFYASTFGRLTKRDRARNGI